jgi:hypothetical protein
VLSVAAIAAVAAVLGGVAAVTARDGRIVVIGLLVAAVASPLVADPLPSSLAVTARILGALLAAYLLWVVAGAGTSRGDSSSSNDTASLGPAWLRTSGSPIGPLAECAVAAAAYVVGLAVRPVDPLGGPVEAQAAGIALIALAVVPMAGRDVFRMGLGVMLLTIGAALVMYAWSGPTPPLEELGLAALLVGIAGGTSILIPTAEAEAMAAAEAEVEAVRVRADRALRAGLDRAEEATASRPAPGAPEPERRPKPMTADPIEDDWLAWTSPDPQAPHRTSPRGARRPQMPDQGKVAKPDPHKPDRSRPDLHGKP